MRRSSSTRQCSKLRVDEKNLAERDLPVNMLRRPETLITLRKLLYRFSRSDWRVWSRSPTGSGNMTRSMACATPCGIRMSFFSSKTRAPLIVRTCQDAITQINHIFHPRNNRLQLILVLTTEKFAPSGSRV